ncbi:MAG: methyl-accepting chemotaxis protein [Elstera sp.]
MAEHRTPKSWTPRLTLRRVLLALFVIVAVAVGFQQSRMITRYTQFATDTLNSSTGHILTFFVRDRLTRVYGERISPIANEWSRATGLGQATEDKDAVKLGFMVDTFYTLTPVVEQQIQLIAVNIFTPEMAFIARASKGEKATGTEDAMLLDQLKARDKGAQRQQVTHLWQSSTGRPMHSIFVPVGGFRVLGVMEIVTDPVHLLDGIGPSLNGTVEVFDGKNQAVYKSEGLPDTVETVATARATLMGTNGRPWADVALTRGIDTFVEQVDEVQSEGQTALLLLAAVVIVGGYLVLRMAVFRPLGAFARVMEAVASGNTKQEIPPTGPDEMAVMARSLAHLRSSVETVLQLKQMVDSSPTPTALLGKDGAVAFLNPAARTFCEKHALTTESNDLLGLGEAQLHRCLAGQGEALRGLQVHIGETDITASLEPVRNGVGEIVGIALTWIDVTAQMIATRQAEVMMQDVQTVASSVARQAQSLDHVAESLIERSRHTITLADDVGGLMAQSSQSALQVSGATEQLTTAIREISERASDAQRSADSATRFLTETGDTVKTLANSAAEVDGIVQFITSLADQTKLLALNATIEAARAGESGRGFAVVAQEVKKLAESTTSATSRIAETVHAIRDNLNATVRGFESVRSAVTEVNMLQTSIASAVEQHNATSSEVASRVGQIATQAQAASSLIQQVLSEAKSTGSIADTLTNSARSLSGEAGSLNGALTDYATQAQHSA